MKKFAKILRKSQEDLKIYVQDQLRNTHKYVKSGDGWVYAKGEIPILLVAHLDTVHKELPQQIYYDQETETLSSPQGIGGDDRCGVYMILEIVKQYNCCVLFCEDEEIGGVGAEKFIKEPFAASLVFNYIMEFDRKGSTDAVFYDCDNPEFEDFITQDFYTSAWGTFSDISTLAPYFKCAAVNLSCGYYEAHTTKEYIVIPEMEASISAACDIIARSTEDDAFEYIERKYTSRYYNKSYYDDYSMYFVIEYIDENGTMQWYETVANSRTEAIGRFCIEHP